MYEVYLIRTLVSFAIILLFLKITKKPIIEVKIQGEEIETDQIQAQIARLNTLSLRCFWKITTKQISDSSVFLDRPSAIEDEMLPFGFIYNGIDDPEDDMANYNGASLLVHHPYEIEGSW